MSKRAGIKSTWPIKQSLGFYGCLLLLLGWGIFDMSQRGFSLATYCCYLTLPGGNLREEKELFSQWFYFLTDINVQEEAGILDSVLVRQDGHPLKKQVEEVKGYFNQDENTYLTVESHKKQEEKELPAAIDLKKTEDLSKLKDLNYVYQHYYAASGKMDFDLDMLSSWQFDELATLPISLTNVKHEPKVLIFHTHVREKYAGGASVADVGEALKKELEDKYGIGVLHNTTSFYEADNPTDFPTLGEYERMEPVITSILKRYPSIEVVIDLHRDGVNENVHLVTEVDGRKAAKLMFVNGLCRHRSVDGEVRSKEDLPNPYLKENLAFSLQSQLVMNRLYPGLTRKIYLNEWRYSTHMKPYSLLVEWGAQTNTNEEVYASVAPMAKILATVLAKD